MSSRKAGGLGRWVQGGAAARKPNSALATPLRRSHAHTPIVVKLVAAGEQRLPAFSATNADGRSGSAHGFDAHHHTRGAVCECLACAQRAMILGVTRVKAAGSGGAAGRRGVAERAV